MKDEKETKAIVQIPNSENLLVFSDAMVQSEMFPNVKTKFGAAAIIEYGIELGLPPVVALQTMCVISGKICMEAKAMLSLAIKGGVTHKIVKKNKQGSQVTFSRKGQEPYTENFTIKDAEDLGFLGKQNWRQYPEEMCYWRCISKGLRAFAPDVIMGIYAKEEMEEVKGFSETTKVEEIKVEAKEEIKDAEVVAEEDEKVEEEITKEEKPQRISKMKKKKKEVKPKEEDVEYQPPPGTAAEEVYEQQQEKRAQKAKPEVKEVKPEEPKSEPVEPETTAGDEQKAEVWRLMNLLVDSYKRDPGELDEKLRARLEKGKKFRIPDDLTPDEADAVITTLLNTVEIEKEKVAI